MASRPQHSRAFLNNEGFRNTDHGLLSDYISSISHFDAKSAGSLYSVETAVHSGPYDRYSALDSSLLLPGGSITRRGISLSRGDGQASVERGEWGIVDAPRLVREMYWCSEQSDDCNDFIILNIEDENHVYGSEVWVSFQVYCQGETLRLSNTAPSMGELFNHEMAPRASISFKNGINYDAMLHTRETIARMHQIRSKSKDQASCAADFAEMLSLNIGEGAGLCTPQDLCEIWPATPTSDRRLFELQWYEIPDGSGAEFAVVLINGSSDLSSYKDWWVRLERVELSDCAIISMSHDEVVHPGDGSELKHKVTFDGGIPFAQVISILRSIPVGSNPIIEDCWFYAATLAHKITMQVGDDLGECSIEDLIEIWSGERGSYMRVNRAQAMQEDDDFGNISHFLLLNISDDPHEGRGVWVRLERNPEVGSKAYFSRNRRRLLKKDANIASDVAFETLKFGEAMSALKTLDRQPSMPVETINNDFPRRLLRELTSRREYVHWIKREN
ncbi:unnamed protein product [Rhizoctonia solani]|uniref:Uncharacterized protein n=1 Tax=Rhizoctonia solani TaxID=456999 RepID=A0A8H2W9W7_9AGAM|nr:uncharacterized protein RhiXN_04548 [Rhizoctonia solani]QRW16547.1 hypothetical protein RhiXN_04548 [Rhizoctonia solani]CAE6352635.1 unnamed protein product [Rhizoctonia solani]